MRKRSAVSRRVYPVDSFCVSVLRHLQTKKTRQHLATNAAGLGGLIAIVRIRAGTVANGAKGVSASGSSRPRTTRCLLGTAAHDVNQLPGVRRRCKTFSDMSAHSPTYTQGAVDILPRVFPAAFFGKI